MKLLFICFEYNGNKDAGSSCIHQLRMALDEQGIPSDVLTYAWNGETYPSAQDDCGTIFLAPTWYRHARMKRAANGQIQMSAAEWLRAALARGYAMLREGRHYAQRGVPLCATNALGKKLRKLCRENHYDWVVSVSYPFSNHLTAAKWIPDGTRLALYNLDPYWNNYTYEESLREARRVEEASLYEKAEAIFCTPEQAPDYEGEAFQNAKNRIRPLPYPKLVQPMVEDCCPIEFDSEKINLLYLGTVYGDIRKPEALLSLFETAHKKEPKLRLYIVGKKFGADADRYLRQYKEKLGDALALHEPIPASQTADLLSRADILVNMGNTMPNQMPSKTIEYIATGKPILNVSVNRECNTLEVLKRYPMCMQCFNEDVLKEERAEALAAFCREFAHQVAHWATVSEVYRDMEITQISRMFSGALSENCEQKKD